MRDFETRFQQRQDQFDRDFARAKRTGCALGTLGLIIKLGLIGFFVWVVIVLLQHFAVI